MKNLIIADNIKKKPELLAPAGDLEKLKTALLYGADAVYIGGSGYGLRANAGNFSLEQMREGIEFAHDRGRSVYVAANIYAHNTDLDGFSEYVEGIGKIGADALIVSDAGLFQIIRDTLPNMDVHISTQANITNYSAVDFWHKQGAKRVVLSRELTLAEIDVITNNASNDMVIECFVHGAMCVSYSGRCYLSQYMSGRNANAGDCSQPCRWSYALMEEKRQGEFFPVFEDKRGAYILNSKDMRMIEHIPELIAAGIGSFKIEGRMKSAYYVASTVKAYRNAIDDYFDDDNKYYLRMDEYMAETDKSSHRNYFTGFYFKDKSTDTGQYSENSSYIRGYDYVATVLSYNSDTNEAVVSQRNKFVIGDVLEVLRQQGEVFSFTLTEMYDTGGKPLESAPHAEQTVIIKVPEKVEKYNMLRRAQS